MNDPSAMGPDRHQARKSTGRAGPEHSTHPAGKSQRQVAVIGDGTEPTAPGATARACETALAEDAEIIQRVAKVSTMVVTAAGRDAAPQLAAQIQQLPGRIAAVFLTRTDRARARTVQHLVRQAGGRAVLTDEDASAIALTAATLVYLRRLGRDPRGSRILIAGATGMPILSPLLRATGFTDFTLWNSIDAHHSPLHRVARDADVVLDLLRDTQPSGSALSRDSDPVELEPDRPDGSVITRHTLDGRALVAPGLLRALTAHPGAPPLNLDVYRICAQAVADATPPRRRLHGSDSLAAIAIADAVAVAVTSR